MDAGVDDVDAALKKGDLKFTLDGYKLKGSWVLVRTGGRCGSSRRRRPRSWLLIKHRDDWAGDVDIAEFAPRSVKSDGDFEDILAADKPDVWVSQSPGQGRRGRRDARKIIEKAAALKAGRAADEPSRRAAARPRGEAGGTQDRRPAAQSASAKRSAQAGSPGNARKPETDS